ncbi:PREDICTED: synaptopodin [Aptenodytes forsteri]|uniref:synaptopodin n=1 Tax=Aptenodytes forsteri TaxID=9233 RepID=UPI00090517EE|nr:PREDICTED: synaptopodin [Aptenodytes forsteri]
MQNPCVCGTAEGDTGCWQERGSRGGQRCRQLRDAPASELVEQEGWTGPLGGKASGSCWREPGGLNGDTPRPALDGGSLASVAEPAAPPKCSSSAPELPPTAASPVADPSQEWKVAKIQRVLINPANEPKKAGLSRSASLSEKELKEAKARSRRIAAQLTTVPGPSSKGVLLFHRRTAGTATGTASPASRQQNGVQGRQYYEVHLTLAKPKPVKNRTARPFGTQASPASGQPAEGPPAAELPPPPTYAETLSSPPPLTRVRSPPSYSALYPPSEQKMLPGPPQGCGVSGPNPLPKTGILEESAARRAGKKSMFTFVEKPKLGPNPDLLDLVQSADSRKKQKEQGEPGAEDEPFALGAEAANFVPNSAARDGQNLLPADDAPAWSSCLKSPTIQPKPKPQPSHNLSEARGKGAELFARRQSRMEKFIIEAPSQPKLLRSPSPTMSLPPSWKYDASACLSPMVSRHPSKSPSRPSKTPPASLYGSNLMENEVSQKELEISKHQPYQLQSSLFILSPSKGPARSIPQEMPPPRPSLPDAYPYPQQTSCPTSPLPPSPIWHAPAVPGAGQTTSSPFPGATGGLPLTHGSRASPGAPTEVLLASPCRLLPPRVKGGFQAPRPSYSTRNAGIEPQERRPSLPASPTWTPRLARCPGSLDGWASPASVPELDEGPPTSPPWSERSLSPLRQDADAQASRQMQARLARNIINAARRKSSSPKAVGPEGSRPFTPIPAGPPSLPQSPRPARPESSRAAWSLGSPAPSHKSPLRTPRADGPQLCFPPGMPRAAWAEGRQLLLPASVFFFPNSPLPSPVVGGRSPAKRCTSRSPTDSDISLDSEDSGAKSPGIHSFNLCPRGWTGSLRLKPGGLPSGAPCTS